MAKKQHEKWLIELTSLPTAPGRENRVIAWVEAWAKRRQHVKIQRDQFGNLLLRRHGRRLSQSPIIFTAHMDHPAFVVRQLISARQLIGEFRGFVREAFFAGSKVLLHQSNQSVKRGVVRNINRLEKTPRYYCAVVQFPTDVAGCIGDLLTWDSGPARIKQNRLYAPACDDLSSVAAALAAFDTLVSKGRKENLDVRVLLTRAEEVGFLGAIGVCQSRTIEKNARIIVLENSKSFSDSPLGEGPIVRVGDRTSTFDPDLTYQLGQVANELAGRVRSFKWQRKLMPGGTCEASVFQSYGYCASCLCLPLDNYHNMNEQAGRIDSEKIHILDFHGLIRLLVEVGRRLDDSKLLPSLRSRLDLLFTSGRLLLS